MQPLKRETLVEADVVCGECGRPIRTYHRTITSSMVVALLLLYRFRGKSDEWLHLPSIKMRVRNPRVRAAMGGGDAAELRYWGLIEIKPGARKDGSSRTGLVRLTQRGREFCAGRRLARRTCDVRLGVALRFRGPWIGIEDALRNRFNYEAILGRSL